MSNNSTTLVPITKFMNDVQSGKYQGIISYLTLNEILKIIRNLLVKKGKTDPDVWRREEENAIERIYKLPNSSFEILAGLPDESITSSDELHFGKISNDALEIMKKYSGKVKEIPGSDDEHDGLSTVDTYHIILAKKFNCEKIASFDKDFVEASSEIGTIVLKEEYRL